MIPAKSHHRDLSNISMPAACMLALILSLLTSGLLFLFSKFGHVNNTTLALLFLLPVGICANLWGLLPGSIAALFSFLAFNYFFIPTLYTFQVKKTEDLIVLAAFLCVAIVLSELTGRVRRNLAIASAREIETRHLYEFNTLISGSRDENSAARILLDKIDQIVTPNRIEILIESPLSPVFLSKGSRKKNIQQKKPFVIPLQSASGLIGEIRVWMEKTILVSEEHLLMILANQTVLTLERLRLSEEIGKSKILEESDKLKSSLLSSVSHELRSPLAAIKASISSLRLNEIEWDSDARVELMTTVEEEIDHLNDLVGNLLDMSRIEAGVLKPQQKPNILTEILSAVLGRMRTQTENCKFLTDVDEYLPLVFVDYVQIQQVFSNLISNSIKYSPSGSEIKINAQIYNKFFLLVKIENQSLPLPQIDMERIFDKFYRINPSDRITGAGLGLSICKGIVDAHGGKIWAENKTDGIIFNFTLPIKNYD